MTVSALLPRILFLLAVSGLGILLNVEDASVCNRCRCSTPLNTIDCSLLDLVEVPTIPQDVKSLNLSGNNIVDLPWPLLQHPDLSDVDLTNNPLTPRSSPPTIDLVFQTSVTIYLDCDTWTVFTRHQGYLRKVLQVPHQVCVANKDSECCGSPYCGMIKLKWSWTEGILCTISRNYYVSDCDRCQTGTFPCSVAVPSDVDVSMSVLRNGSAVSPSGAELWCGRSLLFSNLDGSMPFKLFKHADCMLVIKGGIIISIDLFQADTCSLSGRLGAIGSSVSLDDGEVLLSADIPGQFGSFDWSVKPCLWSQLYDQICSQVSSTRTTCQSRLRSSRAGLVNVQLQAFDTESKLFSTTLFSLWFTPGVREDVHLSLSTPVTESGSSITAITDGGPPLLMCHVLCSINGSFLRSVSVLNNMTLQLSFGSPGNWSLSCNFTVENSTWTTGNYVVFVLERSLHPYIIQVSCPCPDVVWVGHERYENGQHGSIIELSITELCCSLTSKLGTRYRNDSDSGKWRLDIVFQMKTKLISVNCSHLNACAMSYQVEPFSPEGNPNRLGLFSVFTSQFGHINITTRSLLPDHMGIMEDIFVIFPVVGAFLEYYIVVVVTDDAQSWSAVHKPSDIWRFLRTGNHPWPDNIQLPRSSDRFVVFEKMVQLGNPPSVSIVHRFVLVSLLGTTVGSDSLIVLRSPALVSLQVVPNDPIFDKFKTVLVTPSGSFQVFAFETSFKLELEGVYEVRFIWSINCNENTVSLFYYVTGQTQTSSVDPAPSESDAFIPISTVRATCSQATISGHADMSALPSTTGSTYQGLSLPYQNLDMEGYEINTDDQDEMSTMCAAVFHQNFAYELSVEKNNHSTVFIRRSINRLGGKWCWAPPGHSQAAHPVNTCSHRPGVVSKISDLQLEVNHQPLNSSPVFEAGQTYEVYLSGKSVSGFILWYVNGVMSRFTEATLGFGLGETLRGPVELTAIVIFRNSTVACIQSTLLLEERILTARIIVPSSVQAYTNITISVEVDVQSLVMSEWSLPGCSDILKCVLVLPPGRTSFSILLKNRISVFVLNGSIDAFDPAVLVALEPTGTTQIEVGQTISFQSIVKGLNVSCHWSVNSSGVTSSNCELFKYKFSSPGVYKVEFIVQNEHFSDSTVRVVVAHDISYKVSVLVFPSYGVTLGSNVTLRATSRQRSPVYWYDSDGILIGENSSLSFAAEKIGLINIWATYIPKCLSCWSSSAVLLRVLRPLCPEPSFYFTLGMEASFLSLDPLVIETSVDKRCLKVGVTYNWFLHPKPVFRCTPDLFFNYKLASNEPDCSEATLEYPPFSLGIGNYCVWLNLTVDQQYSHVSAISVRIQHPPSARSSLWTSTLVTGVEQDVSLNATSLFDLFDVSPSSAGTNFKLAWSLSEVVSKGDLKELEDGESSVSASRIHLDGRCVSNHVLSDADTVSSNCLLGFNSRKISSLNCTTVHLELNSLRRGVQYEVVAALQLSSSPETYYQKTALTIVDADVVPIVKVTCVTCHTFGSFILVPGKDYLFTASCTNCLPDEPICYEWSVFSQRLNTPSLLHSVGPCPSVCSDGRFILKGSQIETTTNDVGLVVQVSACSCNSTVLVRLLFNLSQPLKAGNCVLSPDRVIMLREEFFLRCSLWDDPEGTPSSIVYRVMASPYHHGKPISSGYIVYQGNYGSSSFHLPAGDTFSGGKTLVTVSVMGSNDVSTVALERTVIIEPSASGTVDLVMHFDQLDRSSLNRVASFAVMVSQAAHSGHFDRDTISSMTNKMTVLISKFRPVLIGTLEQATSALRSLLIDGAQTVRLLPLSRSALAAFLVYSIDLMSSFAIDAISLGPRLVFDLFVLMASTQIELASLNMTSSHAMELQATLLTLERHLLQNMVMFMNADGSEYNLSFGTLSILLRRHQPHLMGPRLSLQQGSFSFKPLLSDMIKKQVKGDIIIVGTQRSFNPFVVDPLPPSSLVLSLDFLNSSGFELSLFSSSDSMVEIFIPVISPVVPQVFFLPTGSTQRHRISWEEVLYNLDAAALQHSVVFLEVGVTSSTAYSSDQATVSVYSANGTLVSSVVLYPGHSHTSIRLDPSPTRDSMLVEVSNRFALTVPFSMAVFSVSCLFWNETVQAWEGHGCHATNKSTRTYTVCACSHLTTFKSQVFAAPNPLRLELILNPSPVPIVMCVLLAIIYVVAVLFARRRDRSLEASSQEKLFSGAKEFYQYEVRIRTGWRPFAGTTARVGLTLYGQHAVIDQCFVPKDIALTRNSVCVFYVCSKRSLGRLVKVKLWHDNSGERPGWMVNYVIVRNMLTGDKYYFFCNRWLSVDTEDGSIERVLRVASSSELASFKFIFADLITRGFTDYHLWMSLLQRPRYSRFTFVQRTTSCITLLLMWMASSAMWFGDGNYSNDDVIISMSSFAYSQLASGLWTNLPVFLVSSIITFLFRRRRRPSTPTTDIAVHEFEHLHHSNTTVEVTNLCPMEGLGQDDQLRRCHSRGILVTPMELVSLLDQPSTPKIAWVPKTLEPAVVTQRRIKPSKQLRCRNTETLLQSALSTVPEERKIARNLFRSHKLERKLKYEFLDIPETKETAAKQKMTFPAWTSFVTYILCFLLCGISVIIVIVQATGFGDGKLARWIGSLVLSFILDFFVLYPIIITFIVLLLSLVVKPKNWDSEEVHLGNIEDASARIVTPEPFPCPSGAELIRTQAFSRQRRNKLGWVLWLLQTVLMLFSVLVFVHAKYGTHINNETWDMLHYLRKTMDNVSRSYPIDFMALQTDDSACLLTEAYKRHLRFSLGFCSAVSESNQSITCLHMEMVQSRFGAGSLSSSSFGTFTAWPEFSVQEMSWVSRNVDHADPAYLTGVRSPSSGYLLNGTDPYIWFNDVAMLIRQCWFNGDTNKLAMDFMVYHVVEDLMVLVRSVLTMTASGSENIDTFLLPSRHPSSGSTESIMCYVALFGLVGGLIMLLVMVAFERCSMASVVCAALESGISLAIIILYICQSARHWNSSDSFPDLGHAELYNYLAEDQALLVLSAFLSFILTLQLVAHLPFWRMVGLLIKENYSALLGPAVLLAWSLAGSTSLAYLVRPECQRGSFLNHALVLFSLPWSRAKHSTGYSCTSISGGIYLLLFNAVRALMIAAIVWCYRHNRRGIQQRCPSKSELLKSDKGVEKPQLRRHRSASRLRSVRPSKLLDVVTRKLDTLGDRLDRLSRLDEEWVQLIRPWTRSCD